MSSSLGDLRALAASLEGRSPVEILAVAAARNPGRVALACSFGPEDCLLVDLIARADLRIDLFTLDTGCLFPETRALWRELEDRYRIAIRAEPAAPPARDPALPPPWEVDPDACCHSRKVVPLRAALGRLASWVTGIRRDQTPERASARIVEWDAGFGLEKVNPLAAWTSERVWEHLRLGGVPVNSLHEQGYVSIGCAPCTSPVKAGEDPRAGRWRGSEKKECGLHHPRGRPDGS